MANENLGKMSFNYYGTNVTIKKILNGPKKKKKKKKNIYIYIYIYIYNIIIIIIIIYCGGGCNLTRTCFHEIHSILVHLCQKSTIVHPFHVH